MSWDLLLAFDKAHGARVPECMRALDAAGMEVELQGELVVLVHAPTELLEVEAAHRGLDIPDGQAMKPNQRLDMARSMLDHARLQHDGEEGTVHDWLGDGVCELVLNHERGTCKSLWKSIVWSLAPPVHKLRNYFGEHITMYFAWTHHFNLWLIAPAIIGFTMWAQRPNGMTVLDSPFVPFFSLFIVLWGILFVRFWDRRASALACKWNTLDWERKEIANPDYYGEERTSPITGKKELYYPGWKRSLKYLVSALVTGGMLCVAFLIMVCSLNLQGYIRSTENLFHVPYLFHFSQPGQLFDPNGSFAMSLVPVVTHSIVILILNQYIYSAIALQLTKWENHRTEDEFDNALILKRFFFEAFDAYIALFYLAFYERSVTMLRVELVSLYMTDAIRRVLTESVLPLAVQWVRGLCARRTDGKVAPWTVKELLRRDEYEQFDDYLELVIEFGYITLFASAFPLAAACSIVCNLIEQRSDAFKLCFLSRRPTPTRAANIGTWRALLIGQVWLSIVTNCLIFAISSNQMAEWFPELFRESQTGLDLMRVGSGRFVIGLAWGIEHVVVVIALGMWFLIDKRPEWVRNVVAKEEYQAQAARARLYAMRRAQRLDVTESEDEESDQGAEESDADPQTSTVRRRNTARSSTRNASTAAAARVGTTQPRRSARLRAKTTKAV